MALALTRQSSGSNDSASDYPEDESETMSVMDEGDLRDCPSLSGGNNGSSSAGETVRVTMRFRPFLPRERKNGRAWVVQPQRNTVRQLGSQSNRKHAFAFDEVYDESYSTETIYQGLARSVVLSALDGIHGTIFAYGQTSSGKTYTMQGAQPEARSDSGPESSVGVIQMAMHDVFEHIAQRSDVDYLVRVSYIEIYNETVRDLLDPTNGSLSVREHPLHGIVCDCSERIASDEDAILRALREGQRNRSVGATNMNDKSSRSHSIFRVVVESRSKDAFMMDDSDGEDNQQTLTDGSEDSTVERVRVGCLNFVDLAGSESSRHTGASGKRLAEASNINKSLLALSRVVSALGSKRESNGTAHVNFRDSKLTRILQPSLNGSARVLFICCASPSAQYVEDTRSTLLFATRAKRIKINAHVNEMVDDAGLEIQKLKHENRELWQRVQRLEPYESLVQDLQRQIELLRFNPDTVGTSVHRAEDDLASEETESIVSSDRCSSSADTEEDGHTPSDGATRPEPCSHGQDVACHLSSPAILPESCHDCISLAEQLEVAQSREKQALRRIKELEQELVALHCLSPRRRKTSEVQDLAEPGPSPCPRASKSTLTISSTSTAPGVGIAVVLAFFCLWWKHN